MALHCGEGGTLFLLKDRLNGIAKFLPALASKVILGSEILRERERERERVGW
jgi:hypothetical protein